VTERFCQADVLAHTQSTTILNSNAPTRTILAGRRRRRHRRSVHHPPAASFTG
jgi:hypothetical protein